MERVSPEPNTGCWLWTYRINEWGYGFFSTGSDKTKTRKKFYAHRYSYELFKGPIPKGLLVCHSCDTPACVNPDHLWVGTDADNNKDCTSKGRNKPGRHIYRDMRFCKRGHEFTKENTYVRSRDGSRECRTCKNLYRSDRR